MTGAGAFRTRRPAPAPLSDDELRAITTPALVLIGERSPLAHLNRAQARVALMPCGTVEILAGVGHGPGFQRGPEDVTARLLAFFDSTQPDRPSQAGEADRPSQAGQAADQPTGWAGPPK